MRKSAIISFVVLEIVFIVDLLVQIFIFDNSDTKGWWPLILVFESILLLLYLFVFGFIARKISDRVYLKINVIVATLLLITFSLYEFIKYSEYKDYIMYVPYLIGISLALYFKKNLTDNTEAQKISLKTTVIITAITIIGAIMFFFNFLYLKQEGDHISFSSDDIQSGIIDADSKYIFISVQNEDRSQVMRGEKTNEEMMNFFYDTIVFSQVSEKDHLGNNEIVLLGFDDEKLVFWDHVAGDSPGPCTDPWIDRSDFLFYIIPSRFNGEVLLQKEKYTISEKEKERRLVEQNECVKNI